MRKSRPATFGGEGFQYREISWRADLGSLWKSWTVCSDGDPLKEVLLAMPADVYQTIDDIDSALLLERPDLHSLRAQYHQLAETYERLGITVHRCEHPHATANWIFQRDLYCATPSGVVIARPASKERRGEERLMLEILARHHAPILYSMHREALFEGADLLWISSSKALVGLGNRSNHAALAQLKALYPETEFFPLQLPTHIQHLLGLVNFISPRAVGIWSTCATAEHRRILQRAGLRIIEIDAEKEIVEKRSFNWVCLGPDRLLLPADAPKTAALLRKKGITIETTPVDAYRKCGGGLGCLTGILHRA